MDITANANQPTPLGNNLINGGRYKAMVADDSSTVRMIAKQHLLSQNFEVIGEAVDGIDCIKKIEDNDVKPDVLLIDIDMPGKTGLQVVKEIRPKYPTMKIIMVTGHSDQSKVKEAVVAGVNGYIVKPFDRKTILERLAKVLNRKDFV